MRSSFNGPGFASARLDVPASPRYMQATAASRAASRPGSASAAALSVPPDVRDFSTTSTSSALPVDLSDPGPPAGGDANAEMKNLIDFGGDDLVRDDSPRRPFRREIAVPARQAAGATTGGIASPTRGMMLESPRAAADKRLREALPGMFMEAANPPSRWINSDATARERLASPYFSTHDKSLPNARRSQRATGSCLPSQEFTTIAHDADPRAPRAFLTDAGFSSASMHRRGRGGASPVPQLPASNPNEAGVPTGEPAVARMPGHGLASGAGRLEQQLLGGRRARGACSPRMLRHEGSGNFLAWGNAAD